MWLRVGLAWGLLSNAVRLGKLLANPSKWNSLPHWLFGPSIWGIAGPNNFDRASYHQTPFLYSMGRPSYFSMKSGSSFPCSFQEIACRSHWHNNGGFWNSQPKPCYASCWSVNQDVPLWMPVLSFLRNREWFSSCAKCCLQKLTV